MKKGILVKNVILNPSLACANRMYMGRDVDILTNLGVKLFHIDIMDGNYVPNLCLDFDTIRGIKKRSDVPLDIHIMVNDPFAYLTRLGEINPEFLSFHMDATKYPVRMISEIKKLGIRPGVVLNPSQSVPLLDHVIDEVDMVQIMSVEPGFAGQRFLEDSLKKIEKLSLLRNKHKSDFLISVDGGINIERGKQCIERGADIIVVGALAIFFEEIPLDKAYIDYQQALYTQEQH